MCHKLYDCFNAVQILTRADFAPMLQFVIRKLEYKLQNVRLTERQIYLTIEFRLNFSKMHIVASTIRVLLQYSTILDCSAIVRLMLNAHRRSQLTFQWKVSIQSSAITTLNELKSNSN